MELIKEVPDMKYQIEVSSAELQILKACVLEYKQNFQSGMSPAGKQTLQMLAEVLAQMTAPKPTAD